MLFVHELHYVLHFRAPEVRPNNSYISIGQEEPTSDDSYIPIIQEEPAPDNTDCYSSDGENNPFCIRPVSYGSVQRRDQRVSGTARTMNYR